MKIEKRLRDPLWHQLQFKLQFQFQESLWNQMQNKCFNLFWSQFQFPLWDQQFDQIDDCLCKYFKKV